MGSDLLPSALVPVASCGYSGSCGRSALSGPRHHHAVLRRCGSEPSLLSALRCLSEPAAPCLLSLTDALLTSALRSLSEALLLSALRCLRETATSSLLSLTGALLTSALTRCGSEPSLLSALRSLSETAAPCLLSLTDALLTSALTRSSSLRSGLRSALSDGPAKSLRSGLRSALSDGPTKRLRSGLRSALSDGPAKSLRSGLRSALSDGPAKSLRSGLRSHAGAGNCRLCVHDGCRTDSCEEYSDDRKCEDLVHSCLLVFRMYVSVISSGRGRIAPRHR